VIRRYGFAPFFQLLLARPYLEKITAFGSATIARQNLTSQSQLPEASRLRIVYWSFSGHSPPKASPRISPVAVVKLTNAPQVWQVL
jgi:hypothetical protein